MNSFEKTAFRIQKPKYAIGEKKEKLTVKDYLGHRKPSLGRSGEHIYLAECECGRQEEMSQTALNRRIDCRKCATKRQAGTRKEYKKPVAVKSVQASWPVPPSVLAKYERTRSV